MRSWITLAIPFPGPLDSLRADLTKVLAARDFQKRVRLAPLPPERNAGTCIDGPTLSIPTLHLQL